MKKTLTIVGCGAAGAAQLYHLVNELIEENIAEFFEIIVFEKASCIGRGLAYNYDIDSNILNRSADSMSLIHNKKDDFFAWLSNNKNKWKYLYPNIKPNRLKEMFLPRSLFGMYIEDVLQATISRARQHRLKISVIQNEVISIEEGNDQYQIKTVNGWSFCSHYIILCIGNLNSFRFGKFDSNGCYFSSPYPGNKLRVIPSDASVGILGARLSAFDTALALNHNQHKGSISFIAREGYLPTVRSKTIPYEMKVLTRLKIRELCAAGQSISLRAILKLMIKEVASAYGKKLSFRAWFNRDINPIRFYENEFRTFNTRQSMIWQSVMIAFNQVIEDVWNELSDKDKKTFNALYKSKWMSRRVGVPFVSAKKIYTLFQAGQLSLIKGFHGLSYRDGKFHVETNDEINKFDYIIDATGTCEDLKHVDSTLLMNLAKSGLIKADKLGGIEVDFASSAVIRQDQSIEKNLFLVGNMTSGTYFFTSVLELNVKHTLKVAKNIVSDFISSYQSSEEYDYRNKGFMEALSVNKDLISVNKLV